MLSLLILIPLIGAILIYWVSASGSRSGAGSLLNTIGPSQLGGLATIIVVINFILSLVLWIQFDSNTAQFQFVEDWGSIGGLCHFIIGIDGISLFLVILTTFLTIPIILTPPYKGKSPITYLIIILVLESLLIAVFVVLDLLLFYICFESVLIPMFLMIVIWGAREKKIHAAYQFFLYTLLGSLFMLLGILVIYYQTGTTDYQYLLSLAIDNKIVFARENLLWLTFFLSFAVKVPMFPFHLWLIHAHVEAPTGGSMLLAGILLKLGGYGFIRYGLTIFPNASLYFSPFVIALSLIGIIYSSLACLRQIDIKSIIAYSSIAHMNVSLLGIFSSSIQGLEGAVYLMISHGIVSSALFYSIGVIYNRTHTRILKYYRGLATTMPLFSLFFFILSLSNMAVPGTSGFIGELLVFLGIFKINILSTIIASLSIILGAGYTVWLTNRLLFGTLSKYFDAYNDLTKSEFFILLPLVFLTIFFGLFPNIILENIHFSISSIL